MGLVERTEHDGVEALRVGRFAAKINTTCLLYRVGATVIDTGPPNQWPAVRDFLRERPVEQVIVTHHHEDHAGNLGVIARDFGCTAFAPAASVAALANGFHLQYYRRIIWGKPAARVQAQPVLAEMPIGGDLRLIPIATAGHSPDHTCYLEPRRGWLFGGDLFIAPKILYLHRGEDVGGMLDSLRLIQRYDFDTVFCAHRGVVPAGKKALQKKLENLEALCEQTGALHRAGIEPGEITRRLLGKESAWRWFTWNAFTKRNLIEACLRVGVPG